ncbi:MAG TPA: hypothetical protein VFO86_09435 [Terriglobia bacterium]|nr:hypothetical protein [Terriglobia bacterium]
MRKLIHVKKINIPIDEKTHGEAKAQAAREGIGFYRWCIRAIRRAAGLPDEVSGTSSAAAEREGKE